MVVGEGWKRRRYARGASSVEVTVAQMPMKPAEYQAWEQQTRDYPVAHLKGPAASGFFTCGGDEAAPPCDLHVQTETGAHLELAGSVHTTRADLEELYASLAWK
jgi:hypothetical protein